MTLECLKCKQSGRIIHRGFGVRETRHWPALRIPRVPSAYIPDAFHLWIHNEVSRKTELDRGGIEGPFFVHAEREVSLRVGVRGIAGCQPFRAILLLALDAHVVALSLAQLRRPRQILRKLVESTRASQSNRIPSRKRGETCWQFLRIVYCNSVSVMLIQICEVYLRRLEINRNSFAWRCGMFLNQLTPFCCFR